MMRGGCRAGKRSPGEKPALCANGFSADKKKPAMKAGFWESHWIPAFAGMTFWQRRSRYARTRQNVT